MLALQISLLSVITVGLVVAYFILKYKKIEISKPIYITLCSILAVTFFFRYMIGETPIRETILLENSNFSTKFGAAISIIGNWVLIANSLLVAMYGFYRTKGFATILKFWVLPSTLLLVSAMYPITIGSTGQLGYASGDFRTALIGIELALNIGISFVVFMENGGFKTSKKDALALLFVLGALLATMPSYAFQGLFGLANYTVPVKSFNLPHRLVLYFSIILPVILYFLLRKKDKSVIKLCLIYISLGTLISFSLTHKLESFLNPLGWPLHLCNTAMYIVPLCLIFNWKKLFYFTYFINVLGAFLAMAMPNYDVTANLFSASLVNFYINHYIAFFMPLLIVALRVFERPKLREFKYSMVGFGIYFVMVLVFNAWFSNYGDVDYFFVNSDFIAEKLGQWAEDLRNNVWQFSIGDLQFIFYPIYQVLFFIVYVIMGAGMWFVYERAYEAVDTLYDIADRRTKIKMDMLALDVALAGRKREEPMNLESVNQVKIINFSKRYGSSNVYAVKDANLTINSGEVFGFLGPNGAGKSTIIKSIVGIQPITSGKIEVCGYDVDTQSTMAKRNIGFVPDHYALYEKLTGREYINYIADLYGVDVEERNKTMDKYVELFQLTDAIDNKMQTYSHGMKQKISIISALIHNPKVWILDEPLIGLDPTSIFQVKECIKAHAKKGNIVFFSSHLIDIVERVCDKIAIIKKGHILECATIKEIEETTTVEEFYLKTIGKSVSATKVSAKQLEQEEKENQNKKEEKKKTRLEEKLAKKQARLDAKELKKQAKTEKTSQTSTQNTEKQK